MSEPQWHLIPLLTVEASSSSLGRAASPLFEEECDALPDALIADVAHPMWFDRPVVEPALASDDYPGYAVEREARQRSEQRLEREKPHGRIDSPQVIDAWHIALTLDGDALPDIFRPGKSRSELGESLGALSKNLRRFPVLCGWRLRCRLGRGRGHRDGSRSHYGSARGCGTLLRCTSSTGSWR